MGISDEDYANALEHQRAHEVALMKLELQKQQGSLEKAIQNASTYVSTTGTINVGGASTGISLNNVAHPYGTFKVLSEDDLRHEGMKAPLSALVDMWTVRWAGEWVDEKEFQEDDFWRIAMIRLTGANKLEKHNLANQYQSVYRIIE